MKPLAGRLIPLRHFGITLQAASEVVGKKLVRQRHTEQPVLVTDDDF
jgi:hypothetical protein